MENGVKGVKYQEGDWFAVPLRNAGYGLCLLARTGPGYLGLGYFFGPKYKSVPKQEDTVAKTPDSAVFVQQFGTGAIVEGSWPKVCRAGDWSRLVWPVPVFGRINEIDNEAWAVTYDDQCRFVKEEVIPIERAQRLPEDGCLGSGAAEILLTKALSDPGSIRPFSLIFAGDAEQTELQPDELPVEDAVIVRVRLSDDAFGSADERANLENLEDQLEYSLQNSDIGYFDGNEVGMGFWDLHLYGPNAEVLYAQIEPVLRAFNPPAGSYVIKRFGGFDAKEKTIPL